MKTLANAINTLFTHKLQENHLLTIIRTLEKKEYIVVNDGNVSCKLTKQCASFITL